MHKCECSILYEIGGEGLLGRAGRECYVSENG